MSKLPEIRTYKLYWSPEGKHIATVKAKSSFAARRMAPKPYREFLGEIYAVCIEAKAILDEAK